MAARRLARLEPRCGSRPCDRSALSNALSLLRMQCLKVRNRSLQAFREHHRRPPVQQFLCLTNVRTTLSWIVLWQRTMDDSRARTGHRDHLSRQVENRELIWIAAINRSGDCIRRLHQSDHPANQIVDKAERARLLTVSVDGYGLIVEGLNNEIRNDATIIGCIRGP